MAPRRWRVSASTRRLGVAVLALSFLLPLGPPVGPALAVDDACPEPNHEAAAACALAPGAPVAGFISDPDDVDLYRVEAPSGGDLSATLSGLPGQYGLRLLTADGAVKAEVAPPDLADRQLASPGLAPGTYLLAVFSTSGDADPERPYLLQVAIAPPPVAARAYAPPPASQYALQLSDLGPGYSEIGRIDEDDGHTLMLAYLAEDARLVGDPFGEFLLLNSSSRVSLIWSRVFLAEYGQDEEMGLATDELLKEWRSEYNVEPTVGWGSEQVFSFTQAGNNQYLRGVLLRQRNVLSTVQTWGFGHLATWDHISGLMRRTEQRIMAVTE